MQKSLFIKSATVAAAILCIFAFTNGYGDTPAPSRPSLQPPVGADCSAEFRNDVFAHGTTSGKKIGGRIKAISDEWLVLETPPTETWIPRNVIFLIELNKPSA